MPLPRVSQTTDLELAFGNVWGRHEAPIETEASDELGDPRRILEASLARALSRPPCIIPFSGGRDSSTLLALAVRVARAEGLPLPIPVSVRCLTEPLSDETEWQEPLVRLLGLTEWSRLAFDRELEVTGPYAREATALLGRYWPGNAYFFTAILDRVPAATVISGVGGDEIFAPALWRRVNLVRANQKSMRPADVPRLLIAYGPNYLRRRFLVHKYFSRPEWVTDEAWHLYKRDCGRALADENISWSEWLQGAYLESRVRTLTLEVSSAMCATRQAEIVHPFMEADFLRALAGRAPSAGHGTRSEAMMTWFGDVLPEEIVHRKSKGNFLGALWTDETSQHVREADWRFSPYVAPSWAESARHGSVPKDGRLLALIQASAAALADGAGEPPQVGK